MLPFICLAVDLANVSVEKNRWFIFIILSMNLWISLTGFFWDRTGLQNQTLVLCRAWLFQQEAVGGSTGWSDGISCSPDVITVWIWELQEAVSGIIKGEDSRQGNTGSSVLFISARERSAEEQVRRPACISISRLFHAWWRVRTCSRDKLSMTSISKLPSVKSWNH